MCGRYYLNPRDLVEYAPKGLYPEQALDGGTDVCPGMEAPALVGDDGASEARRMRWGFARPEGGLVINARVETIGERPMFRALARERRCALPAARYYEWRRSDRQKFDISLPERFWLAGLWRIGGDGPEFVVLTQPPVDAITPIHNRMPLLLPDRDALERWFGGEVPLYDGSAALNIHAVGPEQLAMRF